MLGAPHVGRSGHLMKAVCTKFGRLLHGQGPGAQSLAVMSTCANSGSQRNIAVVPDLQPNTLPALLPPCSPAVLHVDAAARV